MFYGMMQKSTSTDAGSNIRPMPLTLADNRADDHSRVVHVSRERVTIDRHYHGIAMRLSIPVKAYQGVCVGLRAGEAGGLIYELRLAHRDADLSVSLAQASDDHEIWADWRSWARFLALPTLIERNEGLVEWGHAPASAVAPLAEPIRATPGRRVKRRRAPFVTRRYASRNTMGAVHREDEIIARH